MDTVEQEDIASIGATVQMVRPSRLIDLIVIGSSYPSLPHFRESIITMKSLMRMIPLSTIPESGKGRGEVACLILSIEIWLKEKEPPPDTHQGTALILRVS